MGAKANNNIIVYDPEKGFIKSINQYCGSKIDVKLCSERTELIVDDLSTYSIAFIVTNDYSDMIDVIKMYNQIDHIYLNTTNKEIKKIVSNLKNIHLFNQEKDKIRIMEFIFNKIIGFDDTYSSLN
jgi:hypothetical protein